MVILTATTLACSLLMWGLFVLLDANRQATAERAPLAGRSAEPRIDGDRIVSDEELPQPSMPVSDPPSSMRSGGGKMRSCRLRLVG